jgi:hypothetical protein
MQIRFLLPTAAAPSGLHHANVIWDCAAASANKPTSRRDKFARVTRLVFR